MLVARFLFLLLVATPALALELPGIPPSDRILSLEQVRNFWINSIRGARMPPRPNGLHPKEQEKWDRQLAERRRLVRAIREGTHDTRAQLARLEHNAAAWDRLGDDTRAAQAEERLHALREHLAKLAELEERRRLWVKLGESLDRIDALEAEISSLRAELHATATTP